MNATADAMRRIENVVAGLPAKGRPGVLGQDAGADAITRGIVAKGTPLKLDVVRQAVLAGLARGVGDV